ncbi:MAG: hypothetical protein LBF60_04645, partial [Treponema sp.]|nr:hypothetical protein [Treponema sp.]
MSGGHVGGTIEGVVFINADTNIQTTLKYKQDLVRITLKAFVLSFHYGPIVFKVSAELKGGIPLEASLDLDVSFKYRAAFTGMYGAYLDTGIKYGTTTKKVRALFVTLKISAPYADFYKNTGTIEETLYYVGSDSPTSISFKSLQLAVIPQIQGKIRADISDCVYGEITAEASLPNILKYRIELFRN